MEKNPDGCTYIKCRCGAPFCYTCGEEYEHEEQTAENQHGRARCKCGLRKEVEQRGLLEVVQHLVPNVPKAEAIARARAFRMVRRREKNGRWIRGPPKDVQCAKADYLAECPFGRKCW